ncbi:PREDICTED: pro-opiomelanocortin, partial [Merops nubicus]|uniref:pro-opiomelanocortin n=1 Tax=Merops nubicus TaxID=57421 RepID=UPI0004F01464
MGSVWWRSLPVVVGVVLGLLLCPPSGASGPCWESSRCQDLTSEAGVVGCARLPRAVVESRPPVHPGTAPPQPLPEGLRRYVMSHFRWNKFGRRNSSGGHKREETGGDDPHPAPREEEEGAGPEREEGKRSYSMEHFRWG